MKMNLSYFVVFLFVVGTMGQLCPIAPPTPALTASKTSTSKVPGVSNSNTAALFMDRTYTAASKPAFLNGASFVQLFNDDKSVSSSSSYVTITSTVPSLVYIAFDARASQLPAWLNSAAWRNTNSTIVRVDSPANLIMNLFVSTSSKTSFSLGSPRQSPASGVDSMYVPFVVPDFQCEYFTFSDSFDRADGGPGARYAGGVNFPGFVSEPNYYVDWYISNGNLFTNASGYYQNGALTVESYPHTTYTLQTKAQGVVHHTWGAYFMFGAAEINSYAEQYRITWGANFATPNVSLDYYGLDGLPIRLASVPYPGTNQNSIHYRITKTDAGLITIYASLTGTFPSTPLLSIEDKRIATLRHYGWSQTSEPPMPATVEYVNACGRVCA